MKKIFCLTSLIFLLQLSNTKAADNILVLGGGGESTPEKTIFDQSLSGLAGYLKSSPRWDQNISFNGGHTNTDNILNGSFAKTNKPFTAKEFSAQMDSFKTKIENAKPGEQFIVYIDTHGAMNNGEKSHKVATNIKKEFADLDKISELTAAAKGKNIKLAIIDLSCHSGNTLNLDPNDGSTCFISSTSPHNFGYTDFSENFTKKMAKGKSLEQVYLEARKDSTHPGLPMINTPEGKLMQETGLQIESSLFYNLNDPISQFDKFDNYMKEKIKSEGVCANFNPSQDLLDLIAIAEQMSSVTQKSFFGQKTSKKNFSKLKESLMNYAQLQINLKDDYLKLQDFKNQTITLKSVKDEDITYTLDELYNIDTNSFIQAYENAISKSQKDNEKKFYLKNINFYKSVQQKQEELKSTNEGLKLQTLQKNIKMKTLTAKDLALVVAKEERDFYNSLYKSLQKEDAPNSSKNACRDFIL